MGMGLRFARMPVAHAFATALACLWLCACSAHDVRPAPHPRDASSPTVAAGAGPARPEAGANARDASQVAVEAGPPDTVPLDAALPDAAHSAPDAAVDDVPALTLQLAEGRIRGKLAGDTRV